MRQITTSLKYVARIDLSKLPMRQITRLGCCFDGLYVSKLPMRQITQFESKC